MKKLVLCLMAMLTFAFASNAQEGKKTVKTTTVVKKDGTVKAEKKKTVTKTDDKKVVTKTGVVLKKDGTPDKRYKTKTVLKKDGTPDMRYKVNKTTTVKK